MWYKFLFSKRPEGQERVIGTLLGTNVEGEYEICDSFPVPHQETDQVAVDMQFHQSMFELHRKANNANQIIGWYATGPAVTENSVLIHDFFLREMGRAPIHLVVDTTLQEYKLDVKAFIGTPLTLEGTLGSLFQPVEAVVESFEAEKLGLEVAARAKDGGSASFLSDLDTIETSVGKIGEMIKVLREHVRRIVAKEVEATPEFTEAVTNVLHALPRLDPRTFERIFSAGVHDLLMISYLANLTRAQLALSERLANVL